MGGCKDSSSVVSWPGVGRAWIQYQQGTNGRQHKAENPGCKTRYCGLCPADQHIGGVEKVNINKSMIMAAACAQSARAYLDEQADAKKKATESSSSSHHMEKTEAGLKGLCIREIMTKYTLYYTKYYTIILRFPMPWRSAL